MAYFWRYDEFKFNNIDSSRYNMYIVSKEGNTDSREIGLNSTLNVNESYKNTIFEEKKFNRSKFTIEIAKLDTYGSPYVISIEDYDNILRWLEHDVPLPLEVDGIIYYGCFVEYSAWNAQKGIITLTFEMTEKWAYSNLLRNTYIVNGSKEIKLYNKSNINKNANLNITLELYNPESEELSDTFKITSKNTDKFFELNKIVKGDKIKICGDTHEIYCINDENKNIFKNKKGDFIELLYGENEILIEGTVKVIIEYQFPIGHR